MKKNISVLFVLLSAFAVFTSCTEEGCTDPAAINFNANADKDDGTCLYNSLPSLSIEMGHAIDGAALKRDSIIYSNAAGNDYGISRLRYYVSDVTLYTTGGDSVFIPYYQYIDAFDGQTLRKTVTGNLPEGTYDSVKFNFGLTPRLNHWDSMPNTEPHVSFTWPEMMGGGFHYMQFEGRYRFSPTEIQFYNTHMGHLKNSTANVDPNFSVKQPLPSAIISTSVTTAPDYIIYIEANLNEWYVNPNLYEFSDYENGIMGDPQAQQVLKENGKSVFSVRDVILLE